VVIGYLLGQGLELVELDLAFLGYQHEAGVREPADGVTPLLASSTNS
jgi:hypothetical protein